MAARVGRAGRALASPLQGTILKVAVDEGAEVEEGALICVIEAMKMENEIAAHRAGKVGALAIRQGAAVNAGDQICTIEQAEPARPSMARTGPERPTCRSRR